VRIEESVGDLDPPGPAESATLKRVGAAPDVRLACQIRPQGDMRVTRLIRPPERGPVDTIEHGDAQGAEHVLAVLFLDIRQFTAISEPRLPYDTVFLLNRFFADVGEAIAVSGGWIDKYMGDGLMALFGRNQPVGEACRRALLAARRIDVALERFNADLKGELDGPLRIGMGLHVGPLVMGRIGHPASAAMTVIGRTVNVASRLEQLTKAYRVQIVASASLLNAAGLDRTALRTQRVRVRGVAEPILVALIAHGADLPELDPEQPPRIPKREPAGSGAGAA
jgi:adenylate cyclase